MTDDLISRQSAIEIIQSMYPGMPRVPWMRKDWQKRYEPYIRTENAIRELPSAQPDRKKGRWVKMTGMMPPEYFGHYECSECLWHLSHHDKTKENELRFCPNCGADMRGEENET